MCGTTPALTTDINPLMRPAGGRNQGEAEYWKPEAVLPKRATARTGTRPALVRVYYSFIGRLKL